MSSRRGKGRAEIAYLIERFLDSQLVYPQEWNDFVECRQESADSEIYRRICYDLDPLVNCPPPQDPGAIQQLRSLTRELRRNRAEDALR